MGSFDLSTLPSSARTPGLFGHLLPGSASSSQTDLSLYRYSRHLSEPSQPHGLALPVPGGSPRRSSAPVGLPKVVVHPPEEEEEEVFHLGDEDDVVPQTGKYGTAFLRPFPRSDTEACPLTC